jgi:hypothetical protein
MADFEVAALEMAAIEMAALEMAARLTKHGDRQREYGSSGSSISPINLTASDIGAFTPWRHIPRRATQRRGP